LDNTLLIYIFDNDFTPVNKFIEMTNSNNLYTLALQQAFQHANDYLGELDTESVDVELNYEQIKAFGIGIFPKKESLLLR
jgi:hypothetical protein